MASKLINYVFVDRNSHFMAFTKTGRFLKFNSKLEFDLLVPFIEMDNRPNNNIPGVPKKLIFIWVPGFLGLPMISLQKTSVNLVYLFTNSLSLGP